MDRATDDLLTAPVTESVDVPLHKRRLLEAARAIDPLAPLRRRPLVTVATAAAIGVVAASPAAARAVSQVLPGGVASHLIRMAWRGYHAARAQSAVKPAEATAPT